MGQRAKNVKRTFKFLLKYFLVLCLIWVVGVLIIFSWGEANAQNTISFTIDEDESYHRIHTPNDNNADRFFQVVSLGFYTSMHNDEDTIHFRFTPDRDVQYVYIWIVPYDCDSDTRYERKEDTVYYSFIVAGQTITYEKGGFPVNCRGLYLHIRCSLNSTHTQYTILTLHNSWTDIINPTKKEFYTQGVTAPMTISYEVITATTHIIEEKTGKDIPLDEAIDDAFKKTNGTALGDTLGDVTNDGGGIPGLSQLDMIKSIYGMLEDWITLYDHLNTAEDVVFILICAVMCYAGFQWTTSPSGNPFLGIILMLMFGGAMIATTGAIFGFIPE